MRPLFYPAIGLTFFLLSLPAQAEQAPAGTQGQNYDRLVVEAAGDEEVSVVARIMTINRLPTSSSSIVVTDNGKPVLGPQALDRERWSQTIAIKGGGRHEIVAVCGAVNAEPVYCSLSADGKRAALAN